jgi:hypothetical protein
MKDIPLIFGPTGVGKTEVALSGESGLAIIHERDMDLAVLDHDVPVSAADVSGHLWRVGVGKDRTTPLLGRIRL